MVVILGVYPRNSCLAKKIKLLKRLKKNELYLIGEIILHKHVLEKQIYFIFRRGNYKLRKEMNDLLYMAVKFYFRQYSIVCKEL